MLCSHAIHNPSCNILNKVFHFLDEDEGGGGTSEAEDQRECVTNLLVSPLLLDKHTQCSLTEDKQREQTVKIDLNIRKSSSISTKSQKVKLEFQWWMIISRKCVRHKYFFSWH